MPNTIDLEKVSGLPIGLKEDFTLEFRSPLPESKADVRTLQQMSPVLMDPNSAATRDEMYYMYRKVAMPEHRVVLERNKLRYDITVIPPAKMGQEFNKTLGHYHAVKPGTHFAYPEVYEVLHGTALFMIQKMDKDFKNLISVLQMEAKPGDKIIYPPNYGHVIVNIGKEPLVTANWVADHFDSDYKDITDRHGMAYYVVDAGEGKYNFIPNPHYENVPPARVMVPKNMNAFAIYQPTPMYVTGISNPKALEFLTSPEKYAVELSSTTS
jgi:glucose-6-phosphate isomerase, archaeal